MSEFHDSGFYYKKGSITIQKNDDNGMDSKEWYSVWRRKVMKETGTLYSQIIIRLIVPAAEICRTVSRRVPADGGFHSGGIFPAGGTSLYHDTVQQ